MLTIGYLVQPLRRIFRAAPSRGGSFVPAIGFGTRAFEPRYPAKIAANKRAKKIGTPRRVEDLDSTLGGTTAVELFHWREMDFTRTIKK